MVRRKTGVSGLDEVLKNLNTKIEAVKDGSQRGLHRAGLFIKGKAQLKTPVVTGNLRASAFVKQVNDFLVTVGFTAFYALFVHEDPNAGTGAGKPYIAKGGFTGPSEVGEPKFLESAVKENQKRIVEIIAKDARIK